MTAQTSQYKYIWTSETGEKIPCSYHGNVGNGDCRIRMEDPYDPGQVERVVGLETVTPNVPEPTHTFVWGSMFGSYATGCRIVRELDDGKKLIAFWDDIAEEETERVVDSDALTVLSDESPAEIAFNFAFQGHLYGEDEKANAKAWFMLGYEAGERA